MNIADMDTPLVSILIPCYNHEKFVVETLNSILEQDYPNLEIVLINDGSTDNSSSVISNWIGNQQNEIKIKFIDRANVGLTRTLNEGVVACSGEFIVLLGSDDLLLPNSIRKRLNYLKQFPGKLAVIGDAKVIDENSHIIFESAIEDFYHGNKKNYATDDGLKYSVINEWSVPGPVLMVARKIYDVVGLYPEDFVAEDLNFYLNVIARDLLVFLNEPVALYRVHNANSCRIPENTAKIEAVIVESYRRNMKLFKGEYRKMIRRKLVAEWKYRLNLRVRKSVKKIIGRS